MATKKQPRNAASVDNGESRKGAITAKQMKILGTQWKRAGVKLLALAESLTLAELADEVLQIDGAKGALAAGPIASQFASRAEATIENLYPDALSD